jgi:hypothetical protein
VARRALPGIERGWWGVELPGVRRGRSTYSPYVGTPVPPIERRLDDELDWLGEQPVVPGSLADDPAAPRPARTASSVELDALVAGSDLRVPATFAAFIGDRGLQSRIRSCTACYLDLGDAVVRAPGGRLVHFLSDQQWVLHWLLFVGDDGGEAVLATDVPYGFDGEAPTELATGAQPDSELPTLVCAESFVEFLYRFWIENEIWFSLAGRADARPLTEEQRRYADHYESR